MVVTGVVIALITMLVVCLGIRAAYRNGVNDGYGFRREPQNPGYRIAGEYLRMHCSHRRAELKEWPYSDPEYELDENGHRIDGN